MHPFFGTRDQVTRAIPSARTARRPFAHSPVESTDSSLAHWSAIARSSAHTARRPCELFAKDVAARIRSLISAKTVRFFLITAAPQQQQAQQHTLVAFRPATCTLRQQRSPSVAPLCCRSRQPFCASFTAAKSSQLFFFLIFRPCVVHFRTRNTNSAPVGSTAIA